jgi:hypothetical protein
MEQVMPWQALIHLVEPRYPKSGMKGGRRLAFRRPGCGE